jgi:hypothetical protein
MENIEKVLFVAQWAKQIEFVNLAMNDSEERYIQSERMLI